MLSPAETRSYGMHIYN